MYDKASDGRDLCFYSHTMEKLISQMYLKIKCMAYNLENPLNLWRTKRFRFAHVSVLNKVFFSFKWEKLRDHLIKARKTENISFALEKQYC